MRNVAFLGILALTVILVIGIQSAVRPLQGPAAVAPSTATAGATPLATPTERSDTLRISSSPTPTPRGIYVDQTYKFSVALPDPYRSSARLSIGSTGGQRPAATDAFTARTEQDEAASIRPCETACPVWNYVAVVHVFTGTGAQTPREFYDAFSYSQGQILADITVDGHQALKVTNAPSYPIEMLIKDGDRMFMLGYSIYEDFDVPAGASREKLDQILASFTFVP